MIRLAEKKIDYPEYYEKIWTSQDIYHYDAVRLRALARYGWLMPEHKVCDLGAGRFGTAEYIMEDLKIPCILFAVDYSYTAKEIVNEKFPRLNYIIANAEDTPFKDNYFDLVTAGELIEHYENPEDLAKEMARICKAGGFMTISTVDPHCEDSKNLNYPEHIWDFTPDDLIDLFNPYGKTIYSRVGNYHFILCEKY